MWKKKEAIYNWDFFSTRDDNEVDVEDEKEGEEEDDEEVGHMNLTELLLVMKIIQWVFFM
jgi:hypothetical protein